MVSEPSPPKPRRRVRAAWIVIGLLLGLLAGLLFFRRTAGDLTTERLAHARARWEEAGPASYVLELELSGSLEDRRRIQVEDGEVVAMTTSDVPVPDHTWSYWSVEGLFVFLEQELQNAADPRHAYGVEDPSRVILQADFDPDLGYPEYFLRHVMGTTRSTGWEVVHFEAR